MTHVKFNSALPSLVENFLGREFDNLVAPKFYGNHVFGNLPAVNVLEHKEGFKIEVAAPGLKKENFTLNIHNNVLTISATKESKTEETQEKYTRQEFNYQSFKRTFTLPQTVDGEKIQATYTDGILHIALPKKEEAKEKAARLIEIA